MGDGNWRFRFLPYTGVIRWDDVQEDSRVLESVDDLVELAQKDALHLHPVAATELRTASADVRAGSTAKFEPPSLWLQLIDRSGSGDRVDRFAVPWVDLRQWPRHSTNWDDRAGWEKRWGPPCYSNIALTFAALQELAAVLDRTFESGESDARKVTLHPLQRTFTYFDVSGFSRKLDESQATTLSWIGRAAKSIGAVLAQEWTELVGEPAEAGGVLGGVEAMLCIGDGYVFVHREIPSWPVDSRSCWRA